MKTLPMTVSATAIMAVGAAATVFAAPARADDFDRQPTPATCPQPVDIAAKAVTVEDEETMPPGVIEYTFDQGGGPGAQIAWFNTHTMAAGVATMAHDGEAPSVTVVTGPGTVISVMYGSYTGSDGRSCALTPGFDASPVPSTAGE